MQQFIVKCTPAPDLVLWKLIFPHVFFSRGGLFLSQAPVLFRSGTHPHMHTHTHTHACPCTHIHTHTHATTYTHTHSCTHMHAHACTCTHMYTHACTCTHTDMSCAHECARMHIHVLPTHLLVRFWCVSVCLCYLCKCLVSVLSFNDLLSCYCCKLLLMCLSVCYRCCVV